LSGGQIPLDAGEEIRDRWICNTCDTPRDDPTRFVCDPPRPPRPNAAAAAPLDDPEDPTAMRHFSCDLCGKSLTPGSDARYVVRVEGFAAVEPAVLTEADLDTDAIDAMADLLEELDDAEQLDEAPAAGDDLPANARREYDLCPCCYRKLLADPLGLESRRKLQFSQN
jgi:hypothetical protein